MMSAVSGRAIDFALYRRNGKPNGRANRLTSQSVRVSPTRRINSAGSFGVAPGTEAR